MSFFKIFARGFRHSNNSFNSSNNFLGSFMKQMAESHDKNDAKTAKASFFKEPLAGNLSTFYATDDLQVQAQHQTEENLEKVPSEHNGDKTNSFQASVPFMVD